MKKGGLFLAGAIIMVVAVALIFLKKKPEIPQVGKPDLITTVTPDGMKLATSTDPTQVFSKAFWRHPTEDDKILRAERREWSEKDSVRKWQWFLAVRPGRGLLEWLGTNPFSM